MKTQPARRKIDLGITSCLIFLFILLLWFAISQPAIERLIIRLSYQAQRLVAMAVLLLPSIVGMLLGWIGTLKPGHNKPLSFAGLLLNALQTLNFYCGVLTIAG